MCRSSKQSVTIKGNVVNCIRGGLFSNNHCGEFIWGVDASFGVRMRYFRRLDSVRAADGSFRLGCLGRCDDVWGADVLFGVRIRRLGQVRYLDRRGGVYATAKPSGRRMGYLSGR